MTRFWQYSRFIMFIAVVTAGMAKASSASNSISLEELRMQKRFGIGIAAAGPLAVLGIEIDINVAENLSLSGGIGTGIDYNTFAVKGRYLLLGKSVSPYIGAGFARWWSNGTTETKLGPSVLVNRFLPPDVNLAEGFSVLLVYPTLGVQFLHASGFSFSAELQYLFKLVSFANGTYAGLGVHWYF